MEHREVLKKESDNICKLIGPVLLICSIHSQENPKNNSYSTTVAKGSSETSFKGKKTSCYSIEQAVGGSWLVLTGFETYINGFVDPKYPNFDPKHDFLRGVEAGLGLIKLR